MKRRSNILIALLLAAGISILLYPTVSNWVASRNHSRAIVDYAVTVEQLEEQEIERHFARAEEYNRSQAGGVTGDAFGNANFLEQPEDYYSILNINGMVGYVSIPSADIYLPVYHSVSEEVLRKGAGHLPQSAFPVGGEGLHAVLTAHRGLPSSKLFTDLNKLQEEDVFYLHILNRELCYQVDQILVVEPHDTAALQATGGEDYVTLVTCTPYAINSHRLLVRGTRVEAVEADPVKEQLEQRKNRRWLAGGVAGVALAALAVFCLTGKKRARSGKNNGK